MKVALTSVDIPERVSGTPPGIWRQHSESHRSKLFSVVKHLGSFWFLPSMKSLCLPWDGAMLITSLLVGNASPPRKQEGLWPRCVLGALSVVVAGAMAAPPLLS